jgi:hypothetical protein
MNNKMANDIADLFSEMGLSASPKSRQGKPTSWAVSFLLKPDKKNAFEEILLDFSDLKFKLEYEPHGVSMERVLLY